MKEKKFNENIEKIYDSLSYEGKAEYLGKEEEFDAKKKELLN